MLSLRHVMQNRSFHSTHTTIAVSFFSTGESQPYYFSSSYPFSPSSTKSTAKIESNCEVHPNDVVSHFREWFMSRKNPILDPIFDILKNHEDSSADAALSQLNIRVTESLILDALDYEKKNVLSCLKLFDWAGRQTGFHHTKATFNAIFRIISKENHVSLMLDFLGNYMKKRYLHKVRYYSILVVGYALAGKTETALQLFGKMRFQGIDLDTFSYHVLLNSILEEGYFDMVEMLAKQMKARGFQNEVTHAIIMKSFCRQNLLEKGEKYLRDLSNSTAQLSGIAVGTFVDALCKNNEFERAALLVDEFQRKGLVSMDNAYGVWIRNLIKTGKLEGALEFLKNKQTMEGYVPDVFRCNLLICNLLRENKLEEVYDLLEEMKERDIVPDNVTMNAILCFLCKAGSMDIAMELYNSRDDFNLSVNSMAYNYLINTLLGEVSVDEAYRLLRNSTDQGCLLGEKTFNIVADALYREGKLDKMKELVLYALDKNITPKNLTDKLISALCRDSRVEEGYLVHSMLNRLDKSSKKRTYMNLIRSFSKINRPDVACRLLIEMLEKGYAPSRKLVRVVIRCLCDDTNDDVDRRFFGLLEMQANRHHLWDPHIYNYFIDGAGHARRPELARRVYEMMMRSGHVPDLKSDILILKSYLSSHNISHALRLFRDLPMKRRKRKLWNVMILGLCEADKLEYALMLLDDMRANKMMPSVDCYEQIISLYCDLGRYDKVFDLVNDVIRTGRPVSSFIGNVLLLHAMKSQKLYYVWRDNLKREKDLPPGSFMLGYLIGVFSGSVEGYDDNEDVERLIEQCFRINTYTNNMLLRLSRMRGMDNACKYFDRLLEKGHQPNRWTYHTIVDGLVQQGRGEEARKWMDKMQSKGFDQRLGINLCNANGEVQK